MLTLTLTACSSYEGQPISSDPVFQEISYVFPPDQNYDGLSMEERLSLQRALNGIPADSLRIATIQAGGEGIAASTTVHDLLVYLKDNGFEPGDTSIKVQSGQNALSLLVNYKTYPLPEACPNWSYGGVVNQDDSLSSHLGCANAINLSHMVADPSDLVKGKSDPTTEINTSVGALTRYYSGQAPINSATQTSGSGGTTEGN